VREDRYQQQAGVCDHNLTVLAEGAENEMGGTHGGDRGGDGGYSCCLGSSEGGFCTLQAHSTHQYQSAHKALGKLEGSGAGSMRARARLPLEQRLARASFWSRDTVDMLTSLLEREEEWTASEQRQRW